MKVNVTISKGDNRFGRYSYKAKEDNRTSFRLVMKEPCPLDAGDMIKAVIAMKITENVSCEGKTFRYTTCGGFDATMAYPLMTVMVFGMWSTLLFLVQKKGNCVEAPVTSNQWMCFAIKSCATVKKYVALDPEEYRTNTNDMEEKIF